MKLEGSLAQKEKALREAIAAKWGTLADAGVVHARERYVDSFAEWLRFFTTKDSRQRTVLRGAMVALVGFQPMLDDATSCCVPVRLRYSITVVHGFEDKEVDGLNSSDRFNALLMEGFAAFEASKGLGYSNVEHSQLETAEPAEIGIFDKTRAHTVALEIEFEVDC